MGKVRHLLAIAPCYETDPARILDTVESVLARRYPDVIVTAFLGIIDAHRGSMRFANAGHPSPMLRRTHGVEELRAEGLPLGLRRGQPPAYSRTVDLHDARLLALFTDGLLESEHDIIGATQRLRDTLEKDAVLHSHSPARFIEELMLHRDVDDDVAILTLAFEPTQRWSFDAENAKAGQDARGQFVEFLRNNVSDSEAIAAAELVFGELVGNVVRHAPGPIDIDLDWSAPAPVLHVIDRGADFKAKGRLPEDVLSESGRGLFIVNLLSTTLRVEHIPGYGNHVMAELPLRRDVTGAIVETHHAYERT
jgi:anti-sigma regulatory factor (Ser/Thr protein kinase)